MFVTFEVLHGCFEVLHGCLKCCMVVEVLQVERSVDIACVMMSWHVDSQGIKEHVQERRSGEQNASLQTGPKQETNKKKINEVTQIKGERKSETNARMDDDKDRR